MVQRFRKMNFRIISFLPKFKKVIFVLSRPEYSVCEVNNNIMARVYLDINLCTNTNKIRQSVIYKRAKGRVVLPSIELSFEP
jgi:hypothetical protein